MGPFELIDLVGVDINHDVAKSFWEQSFHEPRWQPHLIQARMIAAGRLGRKTGRGYYDYSAGRTGPTTPRRPGPKRGPAPATISVPRRSRGPASGRCASSVAASTRSHPVPTRSASWAFPTSSPPRWSS